MWSTFTDHLEVLWGAAAALGIVVLLTPAVGGMARVLGVVDEPGTRRLNRRAVPRLGGLALFFGIFVPALAFLPLGRETKGLLLGAAVATTVGAIDDFRGLVWWEKLGGQLAAAAIPTGFGIWVHRFTFPIVGVHALPEWVGVPLTILWIVAIMNMVNFLDGLDGLAAGVCAISGFTFCLIALSLGRAEPAVLAAIVFGACLGFPLGALAIQGLLKTAAVATLLFPLLVLAVPIIDTSFVVAKRLKYRRPIYSADRWHLHHRFMNIGFSQRRAAVTMWAWCAVLAGAALALRFLRPHAHGIWHTGPTIAVAVIAAFALGASIYMVYLLEIVKLANPRIRRREQEAREAAERRTA